MSETRIRPRIEVLDPLAPRLEPDFPPAIIEPPAPPGSMSLVGAGLMILVVGLAGLSTGNFVAGQFARGPVLGWVTLGIAAAGFGLIGTAAWRELRGLLGLRSVDRLRARMADPTTTAAAARHWLAMLPQGEALLPAINAMNDPDAIVALLQAEPVAALRAQAEALGRTAAIQAFATTAAIPSPGLDAMLVAWRGMRLVRQVAALHGLRPGLLGTLSLLRRTLLSAAAVAVTEVAADAATRALLSNPLLAHLAGDVAAAGVAARRMVVLARATSAACTPL